MKLPHWRDLPAKAVYRYEAFPPVVPNGDPKCSGFSPPAPLCCSSPVAPRRHPPWLPRKAPPPPPTGLPPQDRDAGEREAPRRRPDRELEGVVRKPDRALSDAGG